MRSCKSVADGSGSITNLQRKLCCWSGSAAKVRRKWWTLGKGWEKLRDGASREAATVLK